MKSFSGKLAVLSGCGSGMGRALVIRLASEGCSVACCDLDKERIEETAQLARRKAAASSNGQVKVKITAHICDVSKEEDWLRFRDQVVEQHKAKCVDLLICQAGIAGGWSFLNTTMTPRAQWDRTFAVNWYGVYYGCRTFMPLVVAAPQGHVVNTSSVNGFYASVDNLPHTSYSAAKFAVKGFTEALIIDCRLHAPHVQMLGNRVSPARIEAFEKEAPVSADQAAEIILDGVKQGKWRILIGEDAEYLDKEVRRVLEEAYEPSFRERVSKAAAERAERKKRSGTGGVKL